MHSRMHTHKRDRNHLTKITIMVLFTKIFHVKDKHDYK